MDQYIDAAGYDVQYTFTPGIDFWERPPTAGTVTIYLVGGGGAGAAGTEEAGGKGGGGGGALRSAVPISYFGDDTEVGVYVGRGGLAHGDFSAELTGDDSYIGGNWYGYGGQYGGQDNPVGGGFYAGDGVTVGGVGQTGGDPFLNTSTGVEMGGLGGKMGSIPPHDLINPNLTGRGGDGGFRYDPHSGAGIPYGQDGAAGCVIIVTGVDVKRYLRMNQRDDTLGVQRAPRLTGTGRNNPTSRPLGKPRRLSQSNTYLKAGSR